jgi:hypothetical protein
MVLVLSGNSFAQNKQQAAQDMAVKLQQKVLLTDEQTAKVKSYLVNYFTTNNQSFLQQTQKSIESILDKRQKAKYEIIKNDWWNSVQKEVSTATQNK